VKRLAKYLGFTIATLAILLCAGGWLVNRWLQSPGAHAAVEEELGRALGMPVKIAKLDFSLTGGLTVGGMSAPGTDGDAFAATGVSASHRLLPMLIGRIALSEVRIDQPRFRFVEDAAGKWRLAPTTTVAPLVVAAAPPQMAPVPVTAPAPPKKKPAVSISRIVLTGGSAEFFDKEHALFASVRGFNVTLNDASAESFDGIFDVELLTLHGIFAIDHLQGIASRSEGKLQIRDITAASGGGGITGDITWPDQGNCAANAKLDRVNLLLAAQHGGVTSPRASGILSGDLHLAGSGADVKTLTGNGTLVLKQGSTREIELLRQICDILSLAALASFEVADATAEFRIANREIALSPMSISVPPFGIALTGPVAFDGTLNLTAYLHAPAEFIGRNQAVADHFSPADANNRRGLQFNVTGPLKRPKQNLAERLTGTKDRRQQRVIAAEAIISALMNGNKPKPAQPPPPPAPAQP